MVKLGEISKEDLVSLLAGRVVILLKDDELHRTVKKEQNNVMWIDIYADLKITIDKFDSKDLGSLTMATKMMDAVVEELNVEQGSIPE